MKHTVHPCLVVILVSIGVLIACSQAPTSPSSQLPSQDPSNHTLPPSSSGSLSLWPSAWSTISDPDNFPLRNDAGGHLVFDSPTTGSMNYLYNTSPPGTISGTVSVSVEITTSGPVIFNYMTEPFNTCVGEASARPFIWANRNAWSEFDRWWSNPATYTLAAGSGTVSVTLAPDRWSSVYGKFGHADATAQAAFNNALKNVSSLGLTFGGGCFCGHGVNVRRGAARFALVSFQVRPQAVPTVQRRATQSTRGQRKRT